MKITKRQIRNIIREEHGSDWGGGAHEYKRDDDHKTGDVDGHYKDYEGAEGGNFGDDSKTDPGHHDYEGGDVEHKAKTAMAAIHDLASAAGVELDSSAGDTADIGLDDLGVTMENNRRRRAAKLTERQLRKMIREEKRVIRRKLYEDSVDDELDNLHKNIGDDIDHIKDLKDDIKDEKEEEHRAELEKERHDEALRREIRKMVRETRLNRRSTRRR
jgi:hypothetical protein